MNNNNFISIWLQFIVAIFFYNLFTSCSKDSELGSAVVSSEQNNLTLIDTFSINAFTQLQEAAFSAAPIDVFRLSNKAIPYMLGGYNDPVTGVATASLAFQIQSQELTLEESALDSISIDSVVLSLRYIGDYGFNTTTSFNVHELTEVLNASSEYPTDYTLSYSSTAFGTTGNIEVDIADSLTLADGQKEPAQLRIALPTAYGQDLLQAGVVTPDNFQQSIKGFYVQVEQNILSTPNTGTLYSFDLNDAFSGVRVYFKDPEGVAKSIRFEIGDESVRFPLFQRTFSSEVLEAIAGNTNNRLYLKSLQSTHPVFSFPSLKAVPKAAFVAKATLTLHLDSMVSLSPLSPHAQLLLLEKNTSATQFNNTLDRSLDLIHYGGNYNVTDDSYTFNVTRYIQEQLEKIQVDSSYVPSLSLLSDQLGYGPARIVIDNQVNKPSLKLYFIEL